MARPSVSVVIDVSNSSGVYEEDLACLIESVSAELRTRLIGGKNPTPKHVCVDITIDYDA